MGCPLCGEESSRRLFFTDIHHLGLSTVMCNRCGLVYLHPRLTDTAQRRFYAQLYRKLYIFENPNVLDDEYLKYRRAFEVASYRIDHYAPFLSGGCRLLDVGSGLSVFLAAIQRRFPLEVMGLEPDQRYAHFARQRFGLQVLESFLEQYKCPAASFGYVCAFHVLEHSRNPSLFLSRINSLLTVGGYLFLEVPNITGSWRGLGMIHLAHNLYFSPNTLRMALEKSGFDVVALEPWEHSPFQSSVSAVARKSSSVVPRPFSLSPRDDAREMEHIFASRLRNWRLDLIKNRASRTLAEWFSPGFVMALKQIIGGRDSNYN